jgi:hypothetical protein
MRRLRDGDLIAGAGGLGLLFALLLDWYAPSIRAAEPPDLDLGVDAWESFAVLDVVLALLALVPLALVALQATRDSPSLPVLFSVLASVAGTVAALLVLYRIVDQPGPNDRVLVEAGAWIGLAASVVIAAGGWRSMRVEAMPGVPAPPVEDLPAPAP